MSWITSNSKRIWWVWLAIIAGGIVAALFIWPSGEAALGPFQPESIYHVLFNLLFVTLILERALEVVKFVWRKPRRDILEAEKAMTQQKLDNADTSLPTGVQVRRPAAQHRIRWLRDKLIKQNMAIEHYRGNTARWMILLSLTVGVLLAWVGMRTLYPLADADSSVPDGGLGMLFHGLDILITAAVISGGSDGIHHTIKRLSKHLPTRIGSR